MLGPMRLPNIPMTKKKSSIKVKERKNLVRFEPALRVPGIEFEFVIFPNYALVLLGLIYITMAAIPERITAVAQHTVFIVHHEFRFSLL